MKASRCLSGGSVCAERQIKPRELVHRVTRIRFGKLLSGAFLPEKIML